MCIWNWLACLVIVALNIGCAGHDDDGRCSISAEQMQDAFSTVPGDADWNPRADLDHDGLVSGSDWQRWLTLCGGD